MRRSSVYAPVNGWRSTTPAARCGRSARWGGRTSERSQRRSVPRVQQRQPGRHSGPRSPWRPPPARSRPGGRAVRDSSSCGVGQREHSCKGAPFIGRPRRATATAGNLPDRSAVPGRSRRVGQSIRRTVPPAPSHDGRRGPERHPARWLASRRNHSGAGTGRSGRP